MKNPKIVLVSEWDGWCGACAAERPLVLTRTGRQRLRTWLTGAADDSRPLVLTCRLCGTGVDVPLEQDDPPVVATWAAPEVPVAAPVPVLVAEVPHAEPAPVPAGELTAARQGVAHALGALLAARTAEAAVPAVVPAGRRRRTAGRPGRAAAADAVQRRARRAPAARRRHRPAEHRPRLTAVSAGRRRARSAASR